MLRAPLVMALLILAAGQARADEALDQLVKNAHYWQERGRADRAVDAWQRVLAADPKNADALVALGTYHARAGRLDRARAYLARLREVDPRHPGLSALERALSTGGGYDELVLKARQLVKSGNVAEAVSTYRRAFGDGAPPDDIALEFYQTLGGTAPGWDEARQGLERLAAHQGGPHARLALAKHLTYREKSRRQGIATLQELTAEPEVAEEARQAWRQALLWLQPGPGDAELFAAFQARAGSDPAIAGRLEQMKKAPAARPGATAARAGYEALERADIDEASRQFGRAVKTNKNDPDALVGAGIVALQQRDFAAAREIFTRVKELAPGRPDIWERSLRSATFWSLLREAETLRQNRREAEAASKLAEAIKVSPEEKASAEVALADLATARGAFPEAESALQAVLAAEPRNVAALEAMVRLRLATGHPDEAAQANARLGEIDAAKAVPAERLRAEVLRGRAAGERRTGLMDRARADLLEARKAEPSNRAVMVDLAYLQLELDDAEEARAVLEDLAHAAPADPEVPRLRVRLLDAEGHYGEALAALEAMPAKDLDDEWRAVKGRLEVRVEAARIVARANRGALGGARLRLLELERRAATRPELMLVVAQSWADLGDAAHAVALASQVTVRSPELPAGARLQLAAVYLRTGRDAELEESLRELAAEPALSTRERADLLRLRIAGAVRHADVLRDKGEQELALGQISPLLRENPEEASLLCALGRIFRGAGENGEASRIFARVLRDHPDNLEARQGAVEAAVSLHDPAAARRLVDEARERSPQDPRVQLLAGRLAVLVGDDAQADELFRGARELLDAGTPAPALAMDRSTTDVLALAAAKVGGGGGTPASVSDAEGDLALQIQAERDRLAARYYIEAQAGFDIRDRAGYGGLAGLTEMSGPVSVSVPLGFRGRLGFTVTPLMLDTGAIDPSSPQLVQRLGTLGLDPGRVPVGSLGSSASGATLALSYSHRWLSLDLGTTPLGLPLQTLVGGGSVRTQLGRVGFAATAGRRVITDSVLSYVGMVDPATGVTWGRVLNEGGRLDLSVSVDSALLYVFGGYSRLIGAGVEQNQSVTTGTGVEWTLYDFDENRVVAGAGLTYLGYDKNLRYFTFGHGGYFSPQHFIHAGLPLKWRGRAGNLRWDLAGDVGINWFRESESPYYPREPDLQSARAGLVDATGALAESRFPAQTNLALGVDLMARAAYQITPQLETGFEAAFRRADYFRELVGGLYIKVAFHRRLTARSGL